MVMGLNQIIYYIYKMFKMDKNGILDKYIHVADKQMVILPSDIRMAFR